MTKAIDPITGHHLQLTIDYREPLWWWTIKETGEGVGGYFRTWVAGTGHHVSKGMAEVEGLAWIDNIELRHHRTRLGIARAKRAAGINDPNYADLQHLID